MSALLRSELLKLRTTRTSWGYVLVLVGLAALSSAARVGSAPQSERLRDDFLSDLVSTGAGLAGVFALLLAIILVTNEFRHGTATPTFLVTPARERVLAAKAAAGALAGVALAAVALLVVAAVVLPWLGVLDVPLHLGGDVVARAGGVVLATALWGMLGVAVGGFVHNQVASLLSALLWLLIAEPLLGVLLRVVGLDGVPPYLPARAFAAITDGTTEDTLSFGGGLAVVLVTIAAAGVLAVWRTRRRDVT